MQIQPIQPNQPSSKMKYYRKTYPISDVSNNIKDYIKLDNGKELEIHTLQINGKVTSKLEYLKNEFGEWVRSRLVLYNRKGKRKFIKTSNKEN